MPRIYIISLLAVAAWALVIGLAWLMISWLLA